MIKPDVKYGVIDRNLSPGTGGVFAQEIRSIFNKHGISCPVHEYIAGLGGRDITQNDIIGIFDKIASDDIRHPEINWIGLKGK
jgi:pyruvate ferredoxin oxidoreductase alpha subunit